MNELVDFEALIDINEVLGSMEKFEGEIQNISQNSLIDALDSMCEAEDRNANCTDENDAKIDKEPTVDDTIDSTDDVINLDEFDDIFSEMHLSVDRLEKMVQKEFSITDLNTEALKDKNIEPVNMCKFLNTQELEQKEMNITGLISSDDSKEEKNKLVDENDISKQTQIIDVIPIDDATVDLKEFEMIFNEIRVSNDKIVNKENMVNHTGIQNEEPSTSHAVMKFDDVVDTNTDHTIRNDENKTAIDKQNECELIASEPEHKHVETLELQKTESDSIIDLDTTESDTELDNLNKAEVTGKTKMKTSAELKDDTKTVANLKETDIIYLISDSEDDGYNSSDFEFISESEAKQNNLVKTNIQSYTYYNADYMKYHRSKYLSCEVISSKAKRESHVVPQGEAFLDLFRGMYAPAVMNNLYYASRKRVLPVTSMTIQDGYGFDVYENNGEENQEYRNEANESLKKIRFLYPEENRKRRRRF